MQLPDKTVRPGRKLPALGLATLSFLLLAECSGAQAPQDQPAPAAPAPAPQQTEKKDDAEQKKQNEPAAPANPVAEVSTQDSPPTFKVHVNLVLVRVVVRDEKGNVVPGLKKEDFQLFDNRKPQAITAFSAETPESMAIKSTAPAKNEDTGKIEPATGAMKLPQRFVAMIFDDIHLNMQDSTYVRDAAGRFFSAMAPSDRVAIFTTSGQFTQPFTADQDLLRRSLVSIVPRPTVGSQGFHDCPDITYYQADLIENRHDSQALAVAAEDAVQCAFGGDESKTTQAASLASSVAAHVLLAGDAETQFAYRHIEEALHRLEVMPGQRVVALVSPGFLTTELFAETSSLIDRANRGSIVINTLDARGLFVSEPGGDISDPPHDSPKTSGFKTSYRVEAQLDQNRVLQQISNGTGGTFFHNRNDLDEGLRQAAAAPALSYLLGFSPQNMKIDGRFHNLKVTLSGKRKYSIQARNGYYAPKSIADPAEAEKREIQEAIFSQEEIHDVPVDVQTQFFKTDAASARLSVVARFDVKGIHFRKVAGRNHDNLTIATAIFDENGNFITGGEKQVQMKLLDTTYNRLSRSGLTLKSSFDVKPGSYMVRLVVRDSEGSQMAARNGAVVIPF